MLPICFFFCYILPRALAFEKMCLFMRQCEKSSQTATHFWYSLVCVCIWRENWWAHRIFIYTPIQYISTRHTLLAMAGLRTAIRTASNCIFLVFAPTKKNTIGAHYKDTHVCTVSMLWPCVFGRLRSEPFQMMCTILLSLQNIYSSLLRTRSIEDVIGFGFLVAFFLVGLPHLHFCCRKP